MQGDEPSVGRRMADASQAREAEREHAVELVLGELSYALAEYTDRHLLRDLETAIARKEAEVTCSAGMTMPNNVSAHELGFANEDLFRSWLKRQLVERIPNMDGYILLEAFGKQHGVQIGGWRLEDNFSTRQSLVASGHWDSLWSGYRTSFTLKPIADRKGSQSTIPDDRVQVARTRYLEEQDARQSRLDAERRANEERERGYEKRQEESVREYKKQIAPWIEYDKGASIRIQLGTWLPFWLWGGGATYAALMGLGEIRPIQRDQVLGLEFIVFLFVAFGVGWAMAVICNWVIKSAMDHKGFAVIPVLFIGGALLGMQAASNKWGQDQALYLLMAWLFIMPSVIVLFLSMHFKPRHPRPALP